MKRVLLFSFFAVACSSTTTMTMSDAGMTDDQYRQAAVTAMHDTLLADVKGLLQGAKDIQAAAPTPQGRGWDAQQDAAAIMSMRAAWVRARTAYERIEGALAPLFPDIDHDIDARYDDFLTEIGPMGDTNLFDDQGVTGMHAIERIVYADVTPMRIVDFEKVLPGYVAAAFPKTEQEALDFKNKLCAKLIVDTQDLLAAWTPVKINAAVAFQGVISLMNEQREKVVKASSNEEESRYAQRTMADLRDNLIGTKNVYPAFQMWIRSKSSMDPTKDGKTIDQKILAGFGKLEGAYGMVSGDAIPAPPMTWSAENPSPADLMTPFGKLYVAVKDSVDPVGPDSVVAQMNNAASVLGFPQFMKGQ